MSYDQETADLLNENARLRERIAAIEARRGEEPEAIASIRERYADGVPHPDDLRDLLAAYEALARERDALRADAERLDWLEDIANEAIEIESFIGDNPEKNAVFIEWAWDDIPPHFISEYGQRIASGRSLREALDRAKAEIERRRNERDVRNSVPLLDALREMDGEGEV